MKSEKFLEKFTKDILSSLQTMDAEKFNAHCDIYLGKAKNPTEDAN